MDRFDKIGPEKSAANEDWSPDSVFSEGGLLHPPLLVERLKELKETTSVIPTSATEFPRVLADSDYKTRSFEEAQKAFFFVLDPDKLTASMQAEPARQNFNYLKQVRRFGQILRAQFIVFDSSHLCPQSLQEFLWALGDFNDNYWLQGRKDTKQQLKARVEASLPGLMQAPRAINITSAEDLKSFLSSEFQYIDSKSRQTKLPMPEFHTLRMKIRNLADSLQVAATENFGKNIHWLFSSLAQMSAQLGGQRDIFLKKALEEGTAEDSLILEVDPSVKEKFDQLRPYLNRICGF